MKQINNKSFFFKSPFTSDWAFWIFVVLFLIFSYTSYVDFYSDYPLDLLNFFGLLAATIDLVVLPGFIAFLICLAFIFLPRKLFESLGKKNVHFQRNNLVFVMLFFIIFLSFLRSNGGFNIAQLVGNFGETSETLTLDENENRGTLKKKPTEITVSPSSTPTDTKSANPSKTNSQTPTQSPTPAPTTSWWPEYFSPWGSTIAYKYNHYFSNGCTVPDQFGCWGGHSIEVRVTEPCSSMSAEFTDESGVITVGYFTSYVSTGQSFSFGTPDATPTTPGRVSNITCTP